MCDFSCIYIIERKDELVLYASKKEIDCDEELQPRTKKRPQKQKKANDILEKSPAVSVFSILLNHYVIIILYYYYTKSNKYL